jgi:hypothetical protein
MAKTTSHSQFRQSLLLIGTILFTLFGLGQLASLFSGGPHNWYDWLGPVAFWALAFETYRESKKYRKKDDHVP